MSNFSYPVFKVSFPEKCFSSAKTFSCNFSDIIWTPVGIKSHQESYILEYHCSIK